MATVQYHCPHCARPFQVDDRLAGQQVACPGCRGMITIAAPTPVSSAASQLACPHCTSIFQYDSTMAGQQAGCPTCGGQVMIPGPAFASVPTIQPSVASQLNCPHCAGLFQVDTSLAGQPASCPTCGGLVMIPTGIGGQQPPRSPIPLPPASEPPVSEPPASSTPVSSPPSGPQPENMLPPSAATEKPKTEKVEKPAAAPVANQPADSESAKKQSPKTAEPLSTPPAPASEPSPRVTLDTPGASPKPTTKVALADVGVASVVPSHLRETSSPVDLASAMRPVRPAATTTSQRTTTAPEREEDLANPEMVFIDPVKTITRGDEQIELKTLTREERTSRRRVANLIMMIGGVAILALTIYLVIRFSTVPIVF